MEQYKKTAERKLIFGVAFLLALFIVPMISASLSNNLQNYYKFNETSGNILIDANNTNNGTIGNNVSKNQIGVLDKSHLWYNYSNYSRINYPVPLNKYSVSFWFKFNNLSGFETGNDQWSIIKTHIDATAGSSGFLSLGTAGTDGFHHVAISLENSPQNSYSSHFTIWTDGVKRYETQYYYCSSNPAQINKNFHLFMYQNQLLFNIGGFTPCSALANNIYLSANNNYNKTDSYIKIDEVAVFRDYYLSSDDVTYLYNSGMGRSYEQIAGTVPLRFVDFEDTFISSFIAYSINGHYSNYESFNVSWFDTTLNQTITMSKALNQSRTSIVGDVNVTLDGIINPNDILFKIQTMNLDRVVNFTVRAININGFDEQQFSITTVSPPSDFSYKKAFLSGFTSFFPDKETLTGAERFAFALIMIIASVVAIMITGKEHIEIALVLASIISILEFIYFVFIGYIGIGIVILLALIGVILTYLKFRRGV